MPGRPATYVKGGRVVAWTPIVDGVHRCDECGTILFEGPNLEDHIERHMAEPRPDDAVDIVG